MNARVSFLDMGSQFLRLEKGTGYLLVAAEAGTGHLVHFDIAQQPDTAFWTGFLSSLSTSMTRRPSGIVHPGNPAIEDALDVVFKDCPRQLCIRHFLAALYQYLRSFQINPLGPNTREMRFYRAVTQLLRASTHDHAAKLYESLKSSPEFAVPELENPISWLGERLPLLMTHYRTPGMPSEARAADRAIAEIMILLKSCRMSFDHRSALEVIQAHVTDINDMLRVELASGPRLKNMTQSVLQASI